MLLQNLENPLADVVNGTENMKCIELIIYCNNWNGISRKLYGGETFSTTDLNAPKSTSIQ